MGLEEKALKHCNHFIVLSKLPVGFGTATSPTPWDTVPEYRSERCLKNRSCSQWISPTPLPHLCPKPTPVLVTAGP
jgi:hypothetical protein